MKTSSNILNKLYESENVGGMTIYDYIVNVCDGEIDMDVSDTEVDMMVALCYDVNNKYGDEYPEMTKFLTTLVKGTKVVKQLNGGYAPVLLCDFSSFFKPYNEQLKDFFDMDYSDFDEDEAYYEAVANLEPLISGNASESQYRELNEILAGKPAAQEEPKEEKKESEDINNRIKKLNEANSLESTVDEAARYLFDEGDSDYLPDYEEFNDSIMEISKDLFDKAKERALEALTNLAEHQYYDHDGGYGTVLELNDNHTIWELNNEKKSDEEWASIVNSKLAQFEADTGVELLLLGRMGRHACVEPTYDNCMNFTYLQETQEKLEQEAIDEFNAEDMNESANIDVNNLTKEQLWKLRQEIVLGSLYTHDYDNSFGIDPSAVCNFFDSFIEDAQMDDYGKPNNRKTEEYDNAEDLYNYYCSCENPFGEVEDINESDTEIKEDVAIDKDPDLDKEQVDADVDYWTEIDEANTEDVSDKEPLGVYTVSNNNSILIYEIEYDINDRVLAGDSSNRDKAMWKDIIYDADETYFWYGDIKVPLDEVMRTNI